MMASKFEAACKEVMRNCAGVERLEVTFGNDGDVDMYWGNMRWVGKPADFPPVLAAIKVLVAAGMTEE